MKIKILSVGRKNADPLNQLVNDYINRIKKFLPVEDIVLKPSSDDKLKERLQKENKPCIVALDEKGHQFTSIEFSKELEGFMNSGKQNIIFVIGQAEGLSKEIISSAYSVISLSKMTLPHRFARLLLTEQIYRGLCIIKNIPYHK